MNWVVSSIWMESSLFISPSSLSTVCAQCSTSGDSAAFSVRLAPAELASWIWWWWMIMTCATSIMSSYLKMTWVLVSTPPSSPWWFNEALVQRTLVWTVRGCRLTFRCARLFDQNTTTLPFENSPSSWVVEWPCTSDWIESFWTYHRSNYNTYPSPVSDI